MTLVSRAAPVVEACLLTSSLLLLRTNTAARLPHFIMQGAASEAMKFVGKVHGQAMKVSAVPFSERSVGVVDNCRQLT